MIIWFSASWILTILPNSVGLLALPLRMTSLCGSNMLSTLSGTFVSPPKIRALVWRMTCLVRSAIVVIWHTSNRTLLLLGLAPLAHLLGDTLGLIHHPPRHRQ